MILADGVKFSRATDLDSKPVSHNPRLPGVFLSMVTLASIRLSNATFNASHKSLTALFVGGTSGIGKGTLIQLVKHSPAPTIYIVGRSEKSATPLLEELKQLNADGKYIFIETECSLIRNVDEVCERIKETEKGLDLLFMSTGYLSLDGRNGILHLLMGVDGRDF